MKRILFGLLLGSLFFGCSLNENKDLVCPAVLCTTLEQSFKLKFLDKNTETDLLFANSIIPARYKLSDVSIYSTRFKKYLTFQVDSSNKTNRFLVFSTAVTDEFVISLANQPQDKLSAETQFIVQPCCDELRLIKLTLNSAPISFTQFTPTTIILKK